MKCPFCGDEMRGGYLQGVRPFYWSAEKASVLMLSGEDDVKVSKGFWAGCHAEADYCPRCKKIITSAAE